MASKVALDSVDIMLGWPLFGLREPHRPLAREELLVLLYQQLMLGIVHPFFLQSF